jgi:hypothetical protein
LIGETGQVLQLADGLSVWRMLSAADRPGC